MVGSTLAIAVAAALVLGAEAPGAGECPGLSAEVERRLPGLSSAIHLRVSQVPGGARVRVLDASRVLDDGVVRGGDCAELAELAARRVREWAVAHGAWREDGALPPPPLVDLDGPSAGRVAGAPAPGAAPEPWSDLASLRLGINASVGALVDAAGPSPQIETWLQAGVLALPFWGEMAILLTPPRWLQVDRFSFSFRRGFVLAAGGAYRLAGVPVEVMGGLQGCQLDVAPVGPMGPGSSGVSSLDVGGYGGVRAVLSLGPVSGWVGARLSAWFVLHQIEVVSPSALAQGAVPVVGLWLGAGVRLGNAS